MISAIRSGDGDKLRRQLAAVRVFVGVVDGVIWVVGKIGLVHAAAGIRWVEIQQRL